MTPIEQKIERDFEAVEFESVCNDISCNQGFEGFKAAALPLHQEIEKLEKIRDMDAAIGMAFRNAIVSSLGLQDAPAKMTPSDAERIISSEIAELKEALDIATSFDALEGTFDQTKAIAIRQKFKLDKVKHG